MVKAGIVGFLPEDGSDVWTFFKWAAETGYRAIDMDLSYAAPEGDLAENTKRLNGIGLTALTVGCPGDFDKALEELPRMIQTAQAQGIKRVTAYSSSISKSIHEGYGAVGTYDEMMHDFEGMNKVIDRLEKEGLTFCYHNHYHEFTTYHHGVKAFDHMLHAVDPRLKFDLDVGWVTSGGFDPVEILRLLKGRIACVHVKDFYDLKKPWKMVEKDPASKEGFTSVGTGVVNIAGVLRELDAQGVEYACVEQDIMRNLDRLEALTMSYLAMKETGFVV